MFVLTKKGRSEAKRYIKELKAKRKEILDAGLDTADDTNLPTVEDIQADINSFGIDAENEYYNGWDVTAHYQERKSAICSKKSICRNYWH